MTLQVALAWGLLVWTLFTVFSAMWMMRRVGMGVRSIFWFFIAIMHVAYHRFECIAVLGGTLEPPALWVQYLLRPMITTSLMFLFIGTYWMGLRRVYRRAPRRLQNLRAAHQSIETMLAMPSDWQRRIEAIDHAMKQLEDYNGPKRTG